MTSENGEKETLNDLLNADDDEMSKPDDGLPKSDTGLPSKSEEDTLEDAITAANYAAVKISFDDMLNDMRVFLTNHAFVRSLHLKVFLEHDGKKAIVYQGNTNSRWAVLTRAGRHYFFKRTLAKTIMNLGPEAPLVRYFGDQLK